MKKILLGLFLGLFLVGCNNGTTDNQPNDVAKRDVTVDQNMNQNTQPPQDVTGQATIPAAPLENTQPQTQEGQSTVKPEDLKQTPDTTAPDQQPANGQTTTDTTTAPAN